MTESIQVTESTESTQVRTHSFVNIPGTEFHTIKITYKTLGLIPTKPAVLRTAKRFFGQPTNPYRELTELSMAPDTIWFCFKCSPDLDLPLFLSDLKADIEKRLIAAWES